MLNILVTGANGQLGQELQELAKGSENINFIFTDVEELDLTDNDAIDRFVADLSLDFIINCAAYTQVDKAEEDKQIAMLINTAVIDSLVDVAINKQATLIHVSTDYVFDGSQTTPYIEDDVSFPLNVYGATKLEGEKIIQYTPNVNAYIVRTSWLYSSFGNNFVKKMLSLSKQNDELSVVFDQVGTPTYARDLAKAILTIVNNTDAQITEPKQEVYHFSNEGVASWYDFAKEIFKIKNINCKVKPVLSSHFNYVAERPRFSVLDKSKIKKDFNIEIPHWADSLKDMLSVTND